MQSSMYEPRVSNDAFVTLRFFCRIITTSVNVSTDFAPRTLDRWAKDVVLTNVEARDAASRSSFVGPRARATLFRSTVECELALSHVACPAKHEDW